MPLVVYSAQGYDKAEVAAFEKASGYTVELDDNSTGPLLTQIEASKNNPKWGLLWVDGATAFAELDDQGLLVRGFEPSVSWNKLGTASVPSDKSYIPTGVTLMAAMVYKPKDSKNPPTTWNSLLLDGLSERSRNERPFAIRADVSLHRRDDAVPGRRQRRARASSRS